MHACMYTRTHAHSTHAHSTHAHTQHARAHIASTHTRTHIRKTANTHTLVLSPSHSHSHSHTHTHTRAQHSSARRRRDHVEVKMRRELKKLFCTKLCENVSVHVSFLLLPHELPKPDRLYKCMFAVHQSATDRVWGLQLCVPCREVLCSKNLACLWSFREVSKSVIVARHSYNVKCRVQQSCHPIIRPCVCL